MPVTQNYDVVRLCQPFLNIQGMPWYVEISQMWPQAVIFLSTSWNRMTYWQDSDYVVRFCFSQYIMKQNNILTRQWLCGTLFVLKKWEILWKIQECWQAGINRKTTNIWRNCRTALSFKDGHTALWVQSTMKKATLTATFSSGLNREKGERNNAHSTAGAKEPQTSPISHHIKRVHVFISSVPLFCTFPLEVISYRGQNSKSSEQPRVTKINECNTEEKPARKSMPTIKQFCQEWT